MLHNSAFCADSGKRVVDTSPERCYSLSNDAGPLQATDASPLKASPNGGPLKRSECFNVPTLNPESLKVLSKGELIRLLCLKPRTFDETDLHFFWRSVKARLETLDKRVREGKEVEEASDFARWVQWSGLVKLFESFPQGEPFAVSAAEILRLVGEVLFDCEMWWKKNPRGPWVAKSELEAVNHKLDLIAGQLAFQHSILAPPVETAGVAVRWVRILRNSWTRLRVLPS
jgi:hypothetical protein